MAMAEFEQTDKLYHYTCFEAACKIIAAQTLLMSQLKKMNDVNEAQRNVYSIRDGESFTWQQVSADFHQCSFAVDKTGSPGYLLLPMWGHYADKGKGVCLVFDKDILLTKVDSNKMWHKKVGYVKKYNPELYISSKDDVMDHFREIFFKKDAQWSYEQEYRVVSHDSSSDKIHFGNALKWVIFFSHIEEESIENSAEYRAIKVLLGNDESKILVYSNTLFGEGLIDCSTKQSITDSL